MLAALSSGWQAIREYRTVAGLTGSACQSAQRRADRLGHRTCVRPEPLRLFAQHHSQPGRSGQARASSTISRCRPPPGRTLRTRASSPASGRSSSIRSGSSQLDAPVPTLAEYLSSRGYQTAGFVANTNCCSYETGLNRGFAHFADYRADAAFDPHAHGSREMDPRASPEPRQLLREEVGRAPVSRRGRDHRRFPASGWAGGGPIVRFFAFLNYFDAHEPYIPPSDFASDASESRHEPLATTSS